MTQVEAVKRELLSHWIALCEGGESWKRQAWRSANDLAREYPSCFADLPELLTQAMKEKQCSTTPTSCFGSDGASGVPDSTTDHGPKPC